MFPLRSLACVALSMTFALVAAQPAEADIVRLTSGRLIKVEAVRFEGDVAVMQMAGGGEVHTPSTLVAAVIPDEVHWARAAALDALASSPTAAGPRLTGAVVRALVDRVARRVGLDSRLAHAIVSAESNYEPLAISARGAMGLMQITAPVAGNYAVRDPYDPEQNLEAGMRHLVGLLKKFGMAGAIAAYNAGAGAVSRYGGVPPYSETQSYVRRVLASMP